MVTQDIKLNYISVATYAGLSLVRATAMGLTKFKLRM